MRMCTFFIQILISRKNLPTFNRRIVITTKINPISKMKKFRNGVGLTVLAGMVALSSCKKFDCHACHYDGPSGEVELGEKCGDDLEDLEASGINVGGTNYEVHCHEH